MKNLRSLLCTGLVLVALGGRLLFAAESAPPPPTTGDRIPPERIELTVIKAFTAKDGNAIFRAYLVKWKDQEVIVSDSLARSNYKEGDTITVLAMNLPFPQGRESHRLLAFSVTLPPPSAANIPPPPP